LEAKSLTAKKEKKNQKESPSKYSNFAYDITKGKDTKIKLVL